MPRLMRISSPVLAVFVTLATVSPLLARQSTLPLTLENIYGNRHRARQGVLSPDGQWVALTANGPEGNGIYLVSTGDTVAGTGPRWVRGRSPAWFPASRRVAFVRDGDLWAVSMASSDAVRLTNDEDNERAPVVSPDGRWVAFYSSRSGHQDIWVVPAEGGEPRAVTTGAYALDDARWAPAWSPDSREIAYVSNAGGYWADDVWVVNVESGQARQISHGLMASTTPVWSPDGSRIALLGTSKDGYWYEDLADIFVLDPLSGAERTVEMQVHATDWLHRMPIFWSGDGEQIYFLYQQRGDFDLWAVPSAGGVATRVTNMGGSLSSVSASATADAFAFVRATPTRGPDLDYLPATGGRLRRLTTFADEWSVVVDPEEISYRSFDGLYIQGFLYLPPGRQPQDRHPTLVHVHGGGTNAYLHGEGLFEQYFASKGYAVLAVNYRGGSGFGRAFQDLSINDWANRQARDAAAAADFLRSQPYSNGRVGIYGYSYGGITTMAAIARVPDAFDAAVPMAGIYDFADAYLNADRIGRIFIKTGHGGSPEERPAVYAVSNTLARIDQIQTPLLVMHGELDVRAPYRQYQLVVDELRKHGKVFESRSYPGESHGLRASARIDMYLRAEEFLDRYLKESRE